MSPDARRDRSYLPAGLPLIWRAGEQQHMKFERWGATMDAADDAKTFDLLERASSEVRALADRMEAIGEPFEARPPNPWRNRIPALVSAARLGNEQRTWIVGADGRNPLGRTQTVAAIWSARDHLYAISNCLTDRTVLSPMSLSRIVMEAACTAMWLNSDGQEPDEILWRSIALARGHLKEQVHLGTAALHAATAWSDEEWQAISAEKERSQNDKSKLTRAAECLGLRTIEDVPKSPIVRDIMGHLAKNLGVDISPAMFYKMYSGAIHSDPNTMIGMLDRDVTTAEGEFRTVSVYTRLLPVAWAVAATTMMIKTVDHWWDTPISIEGIDDHVNELCRIAHQPQ